MMDKGLHYGSGFSFSSNYNTGPGRSISQLSIGTMELQYAFIKNTNINASVAHMSVNSLGIKCNSPRL
uniref:Uncharacterized protein n=1 Tax=Nelumbo nucifera TaxID=4432 RepID=A0A822Y6X2_NELNU|nr:TPA_asm: hypothetical protein HUJ06_028243 [Nelumbo nucifera]